MVKDQVVGIRTSVGNTSVNDRCAGIVTYEPDIERLRTNLEHIASQVQEVFICDNGSSNVQEIEELAQQIAIPLHIKRLGTNKGIAFALNCLLEAARKYEWIVFLDQDSVANEGMVDILASYANERIGLVCPFILDRNRMTEEEYRAMQLPKVLQMRYAAKHGAITSGSLVNVAAAYAVGGFDNELFIDYVDFDFNERLLLAGYQILKVNSVYLLHEKGKSVRTWLQVPRRGSDGKMTWTPVFALGYGPMRCYYQARNRIIFWKKYHRWTGTEGLTEIPLLMALTLSLEKGRFAKLKAYLKGIRDGIRHA